MARATVPTGDAPTEYRPLSEDTYHMRIREADITVSQFRDKDDNEQFQLALVWEIVQLTPEQEEAGEDASRWVRQWMSFYYGETRNGPSKLKAFVDSLASQGLLDEFDPATRVIDSDWFVGIEQRVTLSVKGGYNNVVMIAPLRRRKPAPATPPAPQPTAPARPTRPTRPAPVESDNDIPF